MLRLSRRAASVQSLFRFVSSVLHQPAAQKRSWDAMGVQRMHLDRRLSPFTPFFLLWARLDRLGSDGLSRTTALIPQTQPVAPEGTSVLAPLIQSIMASNPKVYNVPPDLEPPGPSSSSSFSFVSPFVAVCRLSLISSHAQSQTLFVLFQTLKSTFCPWRTVH